MFKDDKRVRDNQSRASNQQKDTKIERNSKSSNSFKDNTTTKIENSSEDSRKDTTSTLIGSIIDEFQNLDGLLSKSDTSLKDSRRKQRQKDDCETEQSTSDKSFENSEPFSEENRTFVPKDSVGSKNNNNSDLDKVSNSSSEKTIKEKSSIGKKYDVDSNELDENEMQPRSRSYSGEDGFLVGPQSKRPRNESSLDATEPEKLLPKQQGRGSQSEEYDEMEATTQSSDDKSGPRNSEVKQPRSSDDPASVNGSRRSSNRSSDGDLIEETNLEDPLEQAKQLSEVPTKNGKIEPLKKPHDDPSLKSKDNGLNDDVFGFGPDHPENKETDEIMKSDRPSAMNEGLANPKTCQGRNDEDPKRDPPKVDERLLQDENQHRGYAPNKNNYDASEDDNKCDPREGENRQSESKDPRLVSRGKKDPGLSTSLDTSREKNRSEEPNDEMFDNSLSLSCGESSVPGFEDDGHRELQTSELKDDSCLMNEDPENEDPGSTATMEKASEPNLDPKFSSMDQAFDGSSYGMKHDAEKDPSQDPKFFTLDQSFDESSDDEEPEERRDPSQDTNFPGLRQALDGSIDDEKPDERRNPSQDPKVSGLEQALDGSSNDRNSDEGSSDEGSSYEGSSDDEKPDERRSPSQDPKVSGLEQALDGSSTDTSSDEGSSDDEKPDERRSPSQDLKASGLEQALDGSSNDRMSDNGSSEDEKPDERKDTSQDPKLSGLEQALDGKSSDEKLDKRRHPSQDPKFSGLEQALDGSIDDEKPDERRNLSQDPKVSGLEQALDGSSTDTSSDEGSSDDEKPDERRRRRRRRSPSQDLKVSGLEQALDGSSIDRSSDEGNSDDEKPDERRDTSQDPKLSDLEQALDGKSSDEKLDKRRHPSQDPKFSGLQEALTGSSDDEKPDERRDPSQDPKFFTLDQSFDESSDDEEPEERRDPSQDANFPSSRQALDGSSNDRSSDEGNTDDEKPDERRDTSQDPKLSGLEQALDGRNNDEKPDKRRDPCQDPKFSGLEQALDGSSNDAKPDERRDQSQDPKFSGSDQSFDGSSDDEKPEERRSPSQDPKVSSLDQAFDGRRDDGSKGDRSSNDEKPDIREDVSEDPIFSGSDQYCDESSDYEEPNENVEVEKPNFSNLRSTFPNDEMETKCSPMNGNDSTTMTSAESGGEVPDDRETPSKSSCDPNAKDDAVNTNTTVSELEDSPLENLNTSLSTESDDEAKENEIPVKPAGIKIDSLSCTDEEASPFESQETSSVPSAYRDSPTIPGFESVPKSDDEPEKTSLMEKFEENSVLEGPERLNTDPKIENGSTSPKKSEPMNEDLKNNRRPDNKKRKISEDDDLPETSQDGAMKANEETPLESICLSPGGRTNPKIVDQLRNSEREAPTEDLNRTNRTPSEDNPQFPQYNEVFSDAPSSDWENVSNKMDDPQNILTGAVPQTNSDDEKKIPEGTPTDLDKPQSSDYQEEFEPLEQQSEVLSLDEKQIAVKTRVEPEHPKNLLKKHETLPCIVDKQAGLLEEAAVDNFGEDSDEDTIGEDARTDVTNREDTNRKSNRISDNVTPGSSQEVPIDEEKSDNEDPPSDIKPQNTETKSDHEKPHLPYPANQENDSKKRKLPQIPGDETKPDKIHVLKKESDFVYKPELLDRREEDPDEMLEPFDKNKPVDDSEPPHVFEEPISKGFRTFDQNYPVLHELQPPHDIDKPNEKPNDSQNYLPGIGEPKFEEENEENLPPGSEDEIADHEEPPRYVSPEELRSFLHDLWPEGKVPDDNGYITVQEVDARSYAVFKPESVDSINSPEFESVEKLDDPLEESDTNTSPIKSVLDSGLSLHDAPNFVDNVQPKNDLSTKDKPKNNQDSPESVLDETSDDTKIAPRKEEPYNQEKLIEPIDAPQPELHEKPDRKFPQSDPNEEHSGTMLQQPDIVNDIDPEIQTSTSQVSPKNLEPGHPTNQFVPSPVNFDPRSTPVNSESKVEPLDDEFTLNDLPTDPRHDEEKIEAQERPKRKLPEMPNEQISEMPYLSEQNNSPKDSTNKPIDNFATNIPSKISAPVDTFPQNTFPQQTNVGGGNTPQDTINQSNHPAKPSKRMLPQIPNTQTDISPLSQELESSQPNCLGRSDPSEEPNSLQYSDPVEPVGERYDIPELDQQLEHVQTAAPCRENNDQKFDDPEVELNELDQSKNDDDEYFFISLPSDCDDETLDQIQQYLMDPETLWKLINGETREYLNSDDLSTPKNEIRGHN